MPQVKDAPKGLNKILESAYRSCKKQNPKYSDARCSKIAWGAAKRAGWHKDKNGKWTKSKSKASLEIDESGDMPFCIEGQFTEFAENDENSDYEIHKAVIVKSNTFMRGIYMSREFIQNLHKGFEKTPHDLNHMGTGYAAGFSVIPSNISYILGFQDNIHYDQKTGEVTADIHINKKALRYNEWKQYVEMSKQMGKMPNVSMFIRKAKLNYIRAADLPAEADWKKQGFGKDDLIPVLSSGEAAAVSTVFTGACNDKDGCGIKNSCNGSECDSSQDELDLVEDEKAYKEYLKNRLKSVKK